jgi:hypothetical protein
MEPFETAAGTDDRLRVVGDVNHDAVLRAAGWPCTTVVPGTYAPLPQGRHGSSRHR